MQYCSCDLLVSLSTGTPAVMGNMYGGSSIEVLVEVNKIENAKPFAPETL